MPHTPIQIATKKKPLRKSGTHRYTNFDKLVLFVSVLYPLSALPQVLAVFGGKTEGVAVLSWVGFFVCACLFFVYGLRRKVLPMIIANGLWIVMDALVIVGIFASGQSVTWL